MLFRSFFPTLPTTPTTPLDLAVLLNLREYIALKAKTAEKKDVRHAIEFGREVRKRLGLEGMERRWLGGKGRERLREEYGKERKEVDVMLVAYAKSVRFGGVKSGVEVPEYV